MLLLYMFDLVGFNEENTSSYFIKKNTILALLPPSRTQGKNFLVDRLFWNTFSIKQDFRIGKAKQEEDKGQHKAVLLGWSLL